MKRLLLLLACAAVLAACTNDSSAPAGKRTEALDEGTWAVSEWISAADAPVIEVREGMLSADGASWFLAAVTNEKTVAKAVWMTTGLGVYDLYVNGKRIGEEVLKPGFTHVQKTRRSFTYDVSDVFVRKAGAENVLSAQLTPGWWADKIVTSGDFKGMNGRKCAFRAVLALTYTDGSTALFGTDTTTWKAGIAGPVQHAGIFDGETYDARIAPGYETPEKLSVPEVNREFSGEILPSAGAEVYRRENLALAPSKCYVWEGVTGAVPSEEKSAVEYGIINIKREYADGETIVLQPGETLVVDFGQNAAAVPDLVFKAAEGTCLTALPAEILNDGNGAEARGMDGPEGSIHRRNLRATPECFRVVYTFGPGEAFVSYSPRCTFFGYRYISFTADAPVTFRRIRSIPVTSIARSMETGTITTGSEEINQLISNTIWGQRSNYLSVPTDCPQRDERLGWTADTQVFTETGTFFAHTDAFFRKWMRDMRDSQSETGAYPGVAPWAQYGNEMMRLGWADAGIIVPWTVWKQFGDKDIVRENWDSMNRFFDHITQTRYDHKALIAENGNYQWADWLSCEDLESCTGKAFVNAETRSQAEHYWSYLGASYWAIDAGMMRDMAAATNRNPEKYQAIAEEAVSYLKESFLQPDGSFKLDVLNTMQTPALFALKNGLVEGEARDAMIRRLRDNFAAHGNCLQTGFLGTSILMETLTANGMADIAYELLFQHNYPSWLYSVDNGATTIWERWNSYVRETGMGPQGMNSFNHYAYGCVCAWIWERVAGIAADSADPGFRHIIMHPVTDPRLGFVKAEYKTPAGLIKSAWKYEGDRLVWTFTIPEGATASVRYPGWEEAKEYGSGTWKLTE